jgi:hypothetical protein
MREVGRSKYYYNRGEYRSIRLFNCIFDVEGEIAALCDPEENFLLFGGGVVVVGLDLLESAVLEEVGGHHTGQK